MIVGRNTAYRRTELVDEQLGVGVQAAKVLRGNEDELAMLHFLGHMNQSRHSQLACLGVQEDIKLVKDTERGLQLLTQRKQKTNGGEATLSATETKKW